MVRSFRLRRPSRLELAQRRCSGRRTRLGAGQRARLGSRLAAERSLRLERHRASNRSAYRLPRYYAPYGWSGGYRRFSLGARLAPSLFARSYWIEDPYAYRLPEAYEPYRWVRYYNDALLIDVETGEVVDAINDIFW